MIQRKKEKESLKDERIKSKLKRIEHLIEFNNVKKGLKYLRKLDNLPESLKHYVLYLKGRAYSEKNNITKAKQFFLKAIKHVETNQKYIYDNIHANAYNQLAKLSYYQNNFEQALIYTNQGINQFVKNGKQKHLWFSLNMNKAVYLERLGYNGEAKEILKLLLKHQSEIDNVEVILNMYDVQGSINRKMGLYDEAIESCRKGLELAQINKKNNRAIELWITLGSIYFDIDNLKESEECLRVALALKSRSKDHHIYLPAYVKLGQIYTRQSKYQEAQKVLNDAINAGKNTRIISTYIPAFVALGDCFYKQRLYDDAIQFYNSALKLAKKHNLLSHEKEILYKLCICYENVDKKTFLNTLVKYFKKNVELDSRKNRKEALIMKIRGDGDLHD